MATWYRIRHWNGGRFGDIKVEEFEVVRETAQMVFYEEKRGDKVRESRARKVSDDYTWFKNRDEAFNGAKDIVQDYIDAAKRRVDLGNQNLDTLKELHAKS